LAQVEQLDTHGVNHQKNTTDRNEAKSFGHGLAGALSLVPLSECTGCWRGDMSANKQKKKDTITRAKRTHAVT